VTAIGVARVRAAETLRPDRLFADPLAAEFVAASGWPAAAADLDQDEARLPRPRRAMLRSIVVRTRFLDDFLQDAGAAGLRQVVLLGAGLDARAFRLDWPADTRLFELDMTEMLDFKESVLTDVGARPACARIAVAIDLQDDFPAALAAAGFDPARPTAWVAEGLLMYLSAERNEELLGRVGALSAPGSRLALTVLSQHRLDRMRESASAAEPNSAQATLVGMWQSGTPADPASWLAGHGWQAEVFDSVERAAAFGRPGLFDGLDVGAGLRGLISAVRAS